MPLSFLMRKKGYGLGWVGGTEYSGGIGEGRAVIRIYCMKKYIFQLKKEIYLLYSERSGSC